MKPIDQDKVGLDGNCFNACLASILELSLPEVPDYRDKGKWLLQYNDWLLNYGLTLIPLTYGSWVPKGYSILGGRSARGLDHAVVAWNGKMIHDPHPDKTGLETFTDWLVFSIIHPNKMVRVA